VARKVVDNQALTTNEKKFEKIVDTSRLKSYSHSTMNVDFNEFNAGQLTERSLSVFRLFKWECSPLIAMAAINESNKPMFWANLTHEEIGQLMGGN